MAVEKKRTPARRANVAVNSGQMESTDNYSTPRCMAYAAAILGVLFAVQFVLCEYAKAVLC